LAVAVLALVQITTHPVVVAQTLFCLEVVLQPLQQWGAAVVALTHLVVFLVVVVAV
jgi:hypothetical protein